MHSTSPEVEGKIINKGDTVIFKKILILFLLASISLESKEITRTQIIMATFVSIRLDAIYAKEIEPAFRIFKSVENSLSSYDKDATIYKLNQNKSVKLDKYSFDALELSHLYYKQTDGYFDISIGSLTKDAYSFGSEPKIPSKKTIANSRVEFSSISYEIDEANISKDIKLDFGGMGKGFGVDRVSEYLMSKGIKKATVSASGDIRCLGFCSVGVQDPFSEGVLLSFTTLKKNLGITTSGNYNRFVKNTDNNHLINPKTKKPQTNFISITLIGEMASSDLDAYATAVSVMPIEKAYRFLNSLDLAYIILQSDKKLRFSYNLSGFVYTSFINYAKSKHP